MKWQKLGHIFVANGHLPWMSTHAATPFALSSDEDVVRCYFSTRDTKNCSHLAYLDLKISSVEVVALCAKPVLVPGETGYFDDSGVYMPQIVETDQQRYLYYQGWNLGVTVPFRNSIGLAHAQKNTEYFVKYGNAPIVDRSHVDPLTLSNHWIRKEGSCWRMWYGSNLWWNKNGLDMCFVLKYAESQDGIHWQRSGRTILEPKEGESGIARPTILKRNELYHMWYSRRIGNKETYLLGYAISADGLEWERQDDVINLKPSDSGWDSEMLCYPCVFEHKGRVYMLYNGNDFGKTGFGLAVMEA